MKKLIAKVKRVGRQILGLFPTPLPTGVSHFAVWADSIVSTYDLPTNDQDSIRYAFATMIMHLGPQTARKPKYYFVLAVRAACAKQVAGATFQEIKARQVEATKKATEAPSGPKLTSV